MNTTRGSKPRLLVESTFFFASVTVFLLSSIHITVANHATFDFEKSLSSCEKPCFNGVCLNRSCVCAKGWHGAQCDHCFGRIRLSENQSQITDGPLDYSSSAKCTWLIEPDTTLQNVPLNIRIDNFSTECGWDYLYIYDGDGVYGNQLASLCGEQPKQEFLAPSGKAFIYFFSDLAMNLNGFSISYELNKCPYNCSNQGDCTGGACNCKAGFTGDHCQFEVCQAEQDFTTGPCNSGQCENGQCVCSNSQVHGEFCQVESTSSVWDVYHPKNEAPPGRASHVSIVMDDVIWHIGGEHFDGAKNPNSIQTFNTTSRMWSKVMVSGEVPSLRYDHTVVKYKNKFYMYGGVIRGRGEISNGENITNELWSFDLASRQWKNVDFSIPGVNEVRIPRELVGHTAHVIGSEMYVFFGYNPVFGFMHETQVYNFETNVWSVVNSTDHVHGRFKHASIEHTNSDGDVSVLVYGGFTWNSTVMDNLLQFDVKTSRWTNLPQSGVPLHLHAATLLNGLMIVTGGNANNATSTTAKNHQCFSKKVLQYDIACKQWLELLDAPVEFKRYGHTAVAVRNAVYVTGGFNGRILNDVWKFTPAKCGSTTRPDDCRSINDGVKCVFTDKSCVTYDSTVSYKANFLSFVKQSSPKHLEECLTTSSKQALQVCEEQKDCVSCASKSGCGWCTSGEQCLPSESECLDGIGMLTTWEKCPTKQDPAPARPCHMGKTCASCRDIEHCTWHQGKNWPCVNKEDLLNELYELEVKHVERERQRVGANLPHFPVAVFAQNLFRSLPECPVSCSNRNSCTECIARDQCMWCPSTSRCINLEAYTMSFAYGQCHSWITSAMSNNHERLCQAESSVCDAHRTCAECQRQPECGWLADDSETGLGKCVPGTSAGPLTTPTFKSTWNFIDCPACQCNGHSKCVSSLGTFPPITVEKCLKCANNTIGAHCEKCAPGFFGDARNGGACTECQCNGQADMCDQSTGMCFCRTKGVTGFHCDKCETKYKGNPISGTPCFYELAVDFIFTFKFKNDDKDNYTTEINLLSVPYKRDTDLMFQISCESPNGHAVVALNMTSQYIDGLPERTQAMMVNTTCDAKGFRRLYVASDKGYPFGTDANTTFTVRVYNFKTPITIVVSFAQSPPINWVLFFVIFAACFIVLLVIAGLLWMIKVRIEAYRRNQRRIDEIEHMASRPFASIKVDLTNGAEAAVNGPTPLSIEPHSNYKSGVFTLAVRLPTGGRATTPYGTSGLAVASTLCLLTPQQLGVLQAPDTTENNNGRKRNTLRGFLRLPNLQRPRPRAQEND